MGRGTDLRFQPPTESCFSIYFFASEFFPKDFQRIGCDSFLDQAKLLEYIAYHFSFGLFPIKKGGLVPRRPQGTHAGLAFGLGAYCFCGLWQVTWEEPSEFPEWSDVLLSLKWCWSLCSWLWLVAEACISGCCPWEGFQSAYWGSCLASTVS